MSAQTYAAAPPYSSAEQSGRSLQHRGVEAAIWGMPLVSVDVMRQAFLRDAGAKYGDILYCSKAPTWRFQTTTPDAASLYVYFNFNLKDGPIVLEMPAAIGAALSGTLMDAWETPLADVGLEGDDRGKGAKYVLLPPYDHRAMVDGHIVIRSRSYNGYGLLRAIPVRPSADDAARAIALVKKMRMYPLVRSLEPPPQRHIDIAGILFDGIIRFDDSFYDSLARMVNEEPMQPRDLVAIAQLRSLGIEKGRTFCPDQATRDALKAAIGDVHAHLMRAITVGGSYWPGSQWILSSVVGAENGFSDEADGLNIDERGMTFFLAYAVPKKLGAGSFYTGAYRDGDGEPLVGERCYRLQIPANVPAKRSWAVTAYDLATAGFIRESPQLAIDSNDYRVQKQVDGSIDVHFGPTPAPTGNTANWIYTAPGRPWFAFFRFYRPDRALFDKTWVLPNIERVL